MRILVLGGTGLTGSAVVAAALEKGHSVTALHRGRMQPHPGADSVVVDRSSGVADSTIGGGAFDAVIDVSGYLPAVVQQALRVFGSTDTRWVYVSSTSVFAERAMSNQDETSPVLEVEGALRKECSDAIDLDWRARGIYGQCKVLCEEQVTAASLGSSAILRPCVIAGWHDATWRFPYWVERAGRGGRILAPLPSMAPVAVIDARDLAAFAVRCVEKSTSGTFVLAPDPAQCTMETLLTAAQAAWPDVASEVVWVDPEYLREHQVEPWAELPFWLPDWTGSQGFNAFNALRARSAGFSTRPLAETASWVRAWLETSPVLPDRGLSLTAERERLVLGG